MARGYCAKHWRAWRKHGNPLIDGRQLTLTRPRKYTLNQTYFDQITDERRAYWLGFIAADGYVFFEEGRDYALKVELAACDEGHLAQMCADLDSDRPVAFYRTSAVAVFGSRHMMEALGRLGIVPRKSFTVEPWNGPPELMRHYWRGLFDGDGSIYKVSTRADWGLKLVGSLACVDAFAAWAYEQCGGTASPQPAKGVWTWQVVGGQKPQRLARALYGEAAVTLARKRSLADQLIAIDFAARRKEKGERHAAFMRDAWANGAYKDRKAR